jgi:two-component system OmpR family response regulator
MAKSSPSRLYAGKSSVPASARVVLHGDLAKVGLATVLTILELERRTGVVMVKQARQLVRVEVSQGQVVRARHGGRGPEGVEAIYTALAWSSGQFELYSVAVDPRDEIGMRTTFLLMEAARRIDEPRGRTDTDPLSAA